MHVFQNLKLKLLPCVLLSVQRSPAARQKASDRAHARAIKVLERAQIKSLYLKALARKLSPNSDQDYYQ